MYRKNTILLFIEKGRSSWDYWDYSSYRRELSDRQQQRTVSSFSESGVVVADSVAGSDPSCSLVEDNYHWCCCCSWLLSQPLMVTSFSVEVKWTGLTVRCYWDQQLTQQPAPTTHSLHLCCSPYSSHSCLTTWCDPVWRQTSPGTTSPCSTSLVCLLSCFTQCCFLT